jgi:SAM-dependent methyltransferase
MSGTNEHLQHLADVYSERQYSVYSRLAVSLEPRGPASLYAAAEGYLTEGSLFLDLGCRDASHLCRLLELAGCSGVGIDPLAEHVEQARKLIAEKQLKARAAVVPGIAERLPFAEGRFDLVWCRDVISVLDDPLDALIEVSRVLAASGVAIIYLNFATDLLERRERKWLNAALGNVAVSMNEAAFEMAVAESGLVIRQKDVIGTEWREFEEERTRPVSDDLLKLARLRRQRESVIAEFGEDVYLTAEASLHWLAYQLLGKLKPVMYVLAAPR